MEEQKEKLSAIAQAKPYKIIISKPAGGEIPYRRIVIERKESYYQAAAYTEKQVFHENIPPEKLAEYLGKTAVGQYLQVNAWDDAAEHIYLCSKKGKVTEFGSQPEPLCRRFALSGAGGRYVADRL